MAEQPTTALPAPGILCRSCGIPGTISYVPGEWFNTFACVTCGEVVPCHGGFARPAAGLRFRRAAGWPSLQLLGKAAVP
jgi:hypothetical protein